MDGVLEGAAALSACKLVCSLLFLPSQAASYSPISFCFCCLLVFTDFLVAVFLSFFCIFESWLTELTELGDAVALRFLIFLGHTYGAVLLLVIPLIAVETLTTLLWPRSGDAHGQCDVREAAEEEEEEEEEESRDNGGKEKSLSRHVVGYLCCLSVWVIVALDARWGWKREEAWTAACMHTSNSLLRCLPYLFRPMSSTVNLCWGMAFLSLLLLLLWRLLTTGTGLHIRHRAPAWTARTHGEKRGGNNNRDTCRRDPAPVPRGPSEPPKSSLSESDSQRVDPGKTESSCTVHRAYSWNSVQMSAHHHGDFVLVAPQCLSAERGGQERERARKGIPLTFITEEHVDSQCRSQSGWRLWGFPCPGVNVMIGFVGVLSIFVLPLNLSVNILLIRTIESLLELCMESVVSYAAYASDASTSHNETVV